MCIRDRVYMVVIIAVLDSTRVYRLSRAVGLNIVVMDYIEAAKVRGETLRYLLFREILPNSMAPLLAEFGLRFCFVFLTISALSFLGIGNKAKINWGIAIKASTALDKTWSTHPPNVAARKPPVIPIRKENTVVAKAMPTVF